MEQQHRTDAALDLAHDLAAKWLAVDRPVPWGAEPAMRMRMLDAKRVTMNAIEANARAAGVWDRFRVLIDAASNDARFQVPVTTPANDAGFRAEAAAPAADVPGERFACQCEHRRHGAACGRLAERTVSTTYGPFRVCARCAVAGCMLEGNQSNACRIERRRVVRHYAMNPYTGELTGQGGESVEVEPCGAPLFDDEHRARGVCRSCASGWECAENVPTDRGRAQLRGEA